MAARNDGSATSTGLASLETKVDALLSAPRVNHPDTVLLAGKIDDLLMRQSNYSDDVSEMNRRMQQVITSLDTRLDCITEAVAAQGQDPKIGVDERSIAAVNLQLSAMTDRLDCIDARLLTMNTIKEKMEDLERSLADTCTSSTSRLDQARTDSPTSIYDELVLTLPSSTCSTGCTGAKKKTRNAESQTEIRADQCADDAHDDVHVDALKASSSQSFKRTATVKCQERRVSNEQVRTPLYGSTKSMRGKMSSRPGQ